MFAKGLVELTTRVRSNELNRSQTPRWDTHNNSKSVVQGEAMSVKACDGGLAEDSIESPENLVTSAGLDEIKQQSVEKSCKSRSRRVLLTEL